MIEFAVRKSCEAVCKFPDTVIISGTYTIGKERVFLALAEALGSKICVTKEKERILSCLQWSALQSLLTTSPLTARVHVLPMKKLNVNVCVFDFIPVCLYVAWCVSVYYLLYIGFVSISGVTAACFLPLACILTHWLVTQQYSSKSFHTSSQKSWICVCV